MRRKPGGGAFQNAPNKSSDARDYDICVQTTLFVLAVKMWIQNKMPVQIRTSILDLNREEVTALAHH